MGKLGSRSINEFDKLAGQFDKLPFGSAKFMILQPFADFLKRVKNSVNFRKGIDMIVNFRDTIPEQYKQEVLPYLNGMILNSIAASKQSEGMSEQADYVKSKLPDYPKLQRILEVPAEILQKYTGEYNLNGETINVVLNDNKTLNLITRNGPAMELNPVSKEKFTVKYMDGFSVEFILNEKDEVIEMLLTTPGEQMKASKKK